MSTKYKYATVPADERLKMLAGGNEELYKEEIARTQDAISARLANGLDVSEQMKWADTVSYNYNLGKAAAMGIDSSNVSKDGYAQRLFGNMTESVGKNVSTISEPKKITSETPYYKDPYSRSSESLQQTIIDSYVRAINQRGSVLQKQANDYIKSVNEDYEKQIAEVKKAYEKKNKYLDEALLNEGVSKGGGRVLSEELRMEDEYRDLLKSLQAERDKMIADIRSSLMQDLNTLSSEMMMQASDEYYRYNSLLADEKNAQYQKQRDSVEDEKWWADYYQGKSNDEYEKSVTERELEMRQKQNDLDYEKWTKEFEQEVKNSERDDALAREKFQYSVMQDKKNADNTNSENQAKYGDEYKACLELVREAQKSVVEHKSGDYYEPKYSKEQLLKIINSFDLTEEEKRSIRYELGLNS
ncbi:MAG: hypothetical protein E7621_01675 [Ruminococcaceae bacterium]|nr:hypothetical protein [Oscillospiraceae bacterium]